MFDLGEVAGRRVRSIMDPVLAVWEERGRERGEQRGWCEDGEGEELLVGIQDVRVWQMAEKLGRRGHGPGCNW